MSEEMKREFCPRCGIKHLAQARALMKETKKGYPHHVWFAMGHMAEAEDEIVDFMPEQAEAIRTERIKVQDGLVSGKPFVPDFERLMYDVAEAAMLEEVLYDVKTN